MLSLKPEWGRVEQSLPSLAYLYLVAPVVPLFDNNQPQYELDLVVSDNASQVSTVSNSKTKHEWLIPSTFLLALSRGFLRFRFRCTYLVAMTSLLLSDKTSVQEWTVHKNWTTTEPGMQTPWSFLLTYSCSSCFFAQRALANFPIVWCKNGLLSSVSSYFLFPAVLLPFFHSSFLSSMTDEKRR